MIQQIISNKIQKNLCDLNNLLIEGWKQIEINHEEGSNQKEERENIRQILEGVNTGVYIYTNKEEEVLYIGEGRIKDRLVRHYKKSYDTQIKSTRHKFFHKRKEEMTIYYKEIKDKNEGLDLESLLTIILEPTYIKELRNK